MTRGSVTYRSRASDELIAFFEAQIRTGNLKTGQPLPSERKIAQEHGVSRTVAREVVFGLENKGLVIRRTGYRPVVVRAGNETTVENPDTFASKLIAPKSGVRDLFNLHIWMEALLAREAALNATDADLRDFETALNANENAIDDPELFTETDVAFHAVIYSLSGNPLFPEIHNEFTDRLAPHWAKTQRCYAQNKRNFEAHKRIYDAVLLRDPDAAETAVRDHLNSTWRQVSVAFQMD